MPHYCASLTPIPRYAELDYATFRDQFLYANRPVIISDGLSKWNAIKTWSPDYFHRRFKDRVIQIEGEPVTVGDFVERVVQATEEEPAPYLMGTGIGNYFSDLFPELIEDIEPAPEYLFPNWLADRYLYPKLTKRLNRGPRAEIFFGGLGSGFPVLHWDSLHFHAFNGQIYGEKEWVLFAPDQSQYLYPNPNIPNGSLIDNLFKPDLEAFPLLANSARYEGTVRAGELLFIPAGWWHTTRMMKPSISIAINSANESNWADVRMDLVKHAAKRNGFLALLLNGYLTRIEKSKQKRRRHHQRLEKV